MKLFSIIFLWSVSVALYADNDFEKCLYDEMTLSENKSTHTLIAPKLVSDIQEYITVSRAYAAFGAENKDVSSVLGAQGVSDFERLSFKKEVDSAFFFVEKGSAKGDIVCAYQQGNRLKFQEWLYIGQNAKIVIDKLAIGREVDAIYIERGETVVEIYFKDGLVSLLRYRGYFD